MLCLNTKIRQVIIVKVLKKIIQTLKNKIMDCWMMEDLDYSEELEKIDKQNQEEETKN